MRLIKSIFDPLIPPVSGVNISDWLFEQYQPRREISSRPIPEIDFNLLNISINDWLFEQYQPSRVEECRQQPMVEFRFPGISKDFYSKAYYAVRENSPRLGLLFQGGQYI